MFTTWLIAFGLALLLMLLVSALSGPSRSSSRDDIRRISRDTTDTMRRTSNDFRKHIERETRNRR